MYVRRYVMCFDIIYSMLLYRAKSSIIHIFNINVRNDSKQCLQQDRLTNNKNQFKITDQNIHYNTDPTSS